MRLRLLLLIVLGFLLVDGGAAEAGKRQRCRRSCVARINDCAAGAGTLEECRRSILRQCVRNPSVCQPVIVPTTTTTTLPDGPFSNLRLRVDSVETRYEIGTQVPPPGQRFVEVRFEVTGESSGPFFSSSALLYLGRVGYGSFSPIDPEFDDPCSRGVTVTSRGAARCHTVYQVPESASAGYLAALDPYTAGIRSSEFDIPSIPRPLAALAVTDITSGGSSCQTSRPGFQVLLLHIEFSSHRGASELVLGGSGMSVVTGGARYFATYCPIEDFCDSRIGVPIDGAASCTMAFELPVTAGSATLVMFDARYPTSAVFSLP